MEWNSYQGRVKQYDFQIARMGWIGDYHDPMTFLELLTADDGNNHSNWSSPEYEALLKKAKSTTDTATRMAIYLEAEKLMLADQPVLPIYTYKRPSMVKPYLKGFWNNDFDRHPWMYLYIDRDWRSNPGPDAPPPRDKPGQRPE